MRSLSFVLMMMIVPALGAQTPAHDPSATLRAVLPEQAAETVLGRIAEARARDLPAQALEHRALELIAKGANAREVERHVSNHADAMLRAKQALERARGRAPTHAEIEAGGEVIVRGVDGSAVGELASSAPSGRQLTVPLYVLAGLLTRGLPADEAIARVQSQLTQRFSDEQLVADLGAMPSRAPAFAGRPPVSGSAIAGSMRPGFAGPPAVARPPRGRAPGSGSDGA